MIRGLIFIILFMGLFIGCTSEDKPKITVATAANMEFAMQEILEEFTKENNVQVEVVIASSGQLSAQIEQGAPFDVFVAANTSYPASLYGKEMVKQPEKYAYGSLVLWTSKDQPIPLEDLVNGGVEKIAIPNPKMAPYGVAAIEVLERHGLYEKVKDKLVYAESVSQVNHFISTGGVDVGFTAKSVVMTKGVGETGAWVAIDPSDYQPIQQDLCVIAASSHQEEARLFTKFIQSETGMKILVKYGYITSDE